VESYNLLIFPSAKRDLQDIVDYINETSPQAALNVYDSLVQSIMDLAYLPLRCPYAKDRALRARGYRVLVVDSYLVFYVVKEQTVEIRRIIHGRRRYEFLV
jgi:addiction module RelE/StbE family toxin